MENINKKNYLIKKSEEAIKINSITIKKIDTNAIGSPLS